MWQFLKVVLVKFLEKLKNLPKNQFGFVVEESSNLRVLITLIATIILLRYKFKYKRSGEFLIQFEFLDYTNFLIRYIIQKSFYKNHYHKN